MLARLQNLGRMAMLGGCLVLATSGCVRKGLLFDLSFEINRVPWRTGNNHGDYGCDCGGSGGGCDSGCKHGCDAGCPASNECSACNKRHGKHAAEGEEKVGVAPVVAMPGRFHPVPVRPVFGNPTIAASAHLPVVQPPIRSQSEPETLPPPAPDDIEDSEARRVTPRMKIELGRRAAPSEAATLLARHS